MIKLELEKQELDLIVNCLFDLPAKFSHNLLLKIKDQINNQTDEFRDNVKVINGGA